jgi:hypothetical protein
MDAMGTPPADTLEDVMELDLAARRAASRYVSARAA